MPNTISLPFRLVGVVAIVAGGLIAAATARAPTQPIVWMVAYLVLITGIVQYVLGVGLEQLPRKTVPTVTKWGTWLVLNAGHIGVIAGTLATSFVVLMGGTLLYDIAILWMAWAIRANHQPKKATGYWVLVAIMFISSVIGLALSTM